MNTKPTPDSYAGLAPAGPKTATDVLAASSVLPAGTGAHLKLPDYQLERPLYVEVMKVLKQLGGKWTSGKTQAFVFSTDPTAEIARMVKGEATMNPAKEYQFYPTPDDVADYVVRRAEILADHAVLEPSAGDGALIKAIWRAGDPYMEVDAYEAWERNRQLLTRPSMGSQINVLGDDFLKADGGEKLYDRIVANPPFNKNQDVKHVLHMMAMIKPGGRVVSIMSTHWQFANDGPSVNFRQIVENNPDCIKVEALPARSFNESGTNVNTCLFIFQD